MLAHAGDENVAVPELQRVRGRFKDRRPTVLFHEREGGIPLGACNADDDENEDEGRPHRVG